MNDPIMQRSLLRYSRVAGFLYLLIIICGLFSELYVRGNLIFPEDAAATAQNILNAELLFRFGLVSDLIMLLSDISVAAIFYKLLAPISPILSLMTAFFRLTMDAILGLNLLNDWMAIFLLKSGTILSGFAPEQLQSFTLFLLKAHQSGYDLGLIFFGVHCLLLGYLFFKSGYVPRLLGVLLGLAAVAYLVDSFTAILFPPLEAIVAPLLIFSFIAELSLAGWLLLKGVKFEPDLQESWGGTPKESGL